MSAILHNTFGHLRWGFSLLLVLALHVLAGREALDWHVEADTPIVPQAVLIELPPLEEPPGPVLRPPSPVPVQPQPQPQARPPSKPIPQHAEVPKPKMVVVQKPRSQPAATPKPHSEVAQTKSGPALAPQPPSEAKQVAYNRAALPSASKQTESWSSRLLAHLARHKRYPPRALRSGQQGVARVHFAVNAQGQVLSSSLAKSSGSQVLDRETLNIIQRAQPLPTPPPELLDNGVVEITVPMVYLLRGQ